jgi:hypothetical protein
MSNSTTELIYEASVFSKTVSYKNFKGEINTVELFFALDPLALMQQIAGFKPKTSRSGNPAKRGQEEWDEGEQLKFVRELATKAAGTPSLDGENWTPFEDFEETLAGKAFLTKLASSDGDRREFAEKVILEPFRAFVRYASADPSNSSKDVADFQKMLTQMENIFVVPDLSQESVEERRARLQAEMAALETSQEA